MMAHSVTIRTQTVRTHSSAVVMNVGYCQSWSGVLRLLQLVMGIICVGIIGYYFGFFFYDQVTAHLFFLLIMTTFMIGTFILLLSYLVSFSTACTIPKTTYELFYHSIAFALILSSSVVLLVKAKEALEWKHDMVLAAAGCGLVCAALHFISTILSFRIFKTI